MTVALKETNDGYSSKKLLPLQAKSKVTQSAIPPTFMTEIPKSASERIHSWVSSNEEKDS